MRVHKHDLVNRPRGRNILRVRPGSRISTAVNVPFTSEYAEPSAHGGFGENNGSDNSADYPARTRTNVGDDLQVILVRDPTANLCIYRVCR